jgi:uncharacterized protein YfaS (alpha-2-macroglobulin family)
MNNCKRLLYALTIVATILLPSGCRSTEALPTPVPTLALESPSTASPVATTGTKMAPTAEPTATPAPPRAPRLLEQTPAPGEELGVDEAIILTFDQPMDAVSVERAFTVTPALEGSFSWPDASTLSFVPDPGALTRDVEYTVAVGTEARSQTDLPLAREVSFRQRVIGYLEVAGVYPSPDSAEVSPGDQIIVTFNRPVVPLTGIAEQAGLPSPLEITPAVQGQGTWTNTSIYTFTPSAPLAAGQAYAVTVPAGLASGTASLEEDYTWSFSVLPPSVDLVTPLPDQSLVDPRTTVVLSFPQSMDRTSVSDRFRVVLKADGSEISGRINWQGDTLRFVPEGPLDRGAEYTVVLDAGATVSAGGASIEQDQLWSFTTAPLPRVTSLNPRDGAVKVDLYGSLQIVFSAPMEPEITVSALAITPTVRTYTYWQQDQTELWVSWSLAPSTRYTATLGTSAEDLFGETIDEPITWSFDTRAREPSISLLTEGSIGMYSAYKDTEIDIQHVNISRIDMDLFALSIEELVLLTREGGWPDWDRFTVPSASRIASWTVEAEAHLNSQEILTSALPADAASPLEPGIYLLVAKAPEVSRPERYAFVVSPYNVTLKSTADQALVWVTDLDSGDPVGDVGIALYDFDGGLAQEGRTDDDGLVMLEMPVQERWESVTVLAQSGKAIGAVVSNWSDGITPWDFELSVAWETTSYRTHLWTDRRIYRPGQPVYYKGIVRLDDDGLYSLPEAGTNVEASLMDSQGRTVWDDELALGELGSVDGEIALSDSASLGTYALVFNIGEEYFQTSFEVAEYRAPEFTVSVTTNAPEYVNGDVMQIAVDSSFFFGGPVSGASVRWRVFGDSYYFDRWMGEGRYSFGEYDFYDPQANPSDIGLLTEGAGETDAEGHFAVEVPAQLEGSNSRRFTVQVSVVDLNNQEVTGEASAVVHAGAVYIGLNSDRYVGTAGEAIEIGLLSTDTQGQPKGRTSIDVTVAREEWYSVQKRSEDGGYLWQNEVRETPVHTVTLRTNTAGTARIDWTPPEGGTYRVLAQASDSQGNTVRSALYLWVSGTTFVNWGRENNYRITLIADQESYAPGDVASILVTSPYEGPVNALLTIERGGILEYRRIALKSNSELLKVPIEREFAPDVFVGGAGGDDNEPGYRVGMVMLPVSTAQRELNVEITPDQTEAYQPGDQAQFDIRATDYQGNAVRAELTVQLVDLAVETLIGGTPPSILDSFYRERGLAVTTALSLVRLHIPEEPSGEGKGGGGDGGGDYLRTEFPATALWEPSVMTDKDGRASVSVTLPDNLTTWRLTAQAATADTLVGVGQEDIISNLQLMVRPALPRFLVIGDQPQLGTVIHNNTDEGLEIRVRAESEGLELEQTEQTLVLDAGQRIDLYWPATVIGLDQITVTFAAESGTLHDAVRTTIPVYHATTPEVVGTSGVLADAQTEVIRVPAAADPEQGGLTVNLEPSLAAATQEGLRYLESYPYDCIEQTVSRFLPNLATYRALTQLGLERPALEAPLSQQIATALQRVYALQELDGGWGWWSNGESMPTLTGYVLFGLAQARDAGYVVDEAVIERAIEFLYRYLDASLAVTRDDYDTRAAVLYALAEAGQGDLGRATALFEDRDNLSIFARGYLAMTLHLLEPEEPSRVEVLTDEFVQAGILSSTGLHWEEDARSQWQMNTDTRTTAIIVRALTWIDPQNTLLPQAVRWLTMARSSGRWESTQENAWAILALTDYMSTTGELAADYSYTLAVNGELTASGEVGPDTLDDAVVVDVPMSALTTGGDVYVDMAKKPAIEDGRLYYSAYLRYLLPIDQIQPLDRGIIVYRQYLAEGKSANTISSASVNDLVTVKLTLIAPRDLYYLVSEDPFPAGCEAVDPTLATTRRMDDASLELEPQGAGEEWAWSWYRYWPTHTELRDEKLALFATHLPRGTYEYTYQLRCTTAGDYLVIPAQAYEMYEADVFGRTGGMTFTVEP